MKRSFKDVSLKKTVALPLAANTATTNVIDLGAAAPYPTTDNFTVRVTIDTATGANSKNVNAVIKATNESNGGNAVNIAGLGAPILVAAGNAANVIGANVEVQLPPNLDKRYICASATGEANGGNSADGNLTIELLF
jgi:hypothetical protein